MFLRIYQKQLFILEDVKWSFVLRKPKYFSSNYMNKARILMNESVWSKITAQENYIQIYDDIILKSF